MPDKLCRRRCKPYIHIEIGITVIAINMEMRVIKNKSGTHNTETLVLLKFGSHSILEAS